MLNRKEYLLYVLALCIFILGMSSFAYGKEMHPLTPVDTYSPRSTLQSFLDNIARSYEVFHKDGRRSEQALYFSRRAAQTFDLSNVAPSVRENVAFERALMLKGILDRIDLPDMAEIPGKDDVEAKLKDKKPFHWRIPGTELTIALVGEGMRAGEFLFTPRTVERIPVFYDSIDELPNKRGETLKAYEEYIYSPGDLVPAGLIKALPEWMDHGVAGQAIWQWCGLALTLGVGFGIIFLIFHVMKRLLSGDMDNGWRQWGRLVFPLSSMCITLAMAYFLDFQVNITGDVLTAMSISLECVFFFFGCWAILAGGNILTWIVMRTPGVKPHTLNADMIRLLIRLLALVLVFALFSYAANRIGMPVTAVFTTAGIAGVGVALAARETLANFFGGISIFVDRPFRTGDYIVLDSGERGEVKRVGMRSTRIQTRDDVLITVPNSLITNVKVINESAPEPLFRVRVAVGVAYGSDIDQVQDILMNLAVTSDMVAEEPAPRVRFRTFGDSSLNFELMCWAKRPHDRGRLTHTLNCAIYKAFNETGISIPFPQREIRVCGPDPAARPAEKNNRPDEEEAELARISG